MWKLLVLPTVLLASCASWDEDGALCRNIDDDFARQTCLERVLADDWPKSGDNNGIGPPSCHPASTRPDPDRAPC
jgi:hypothetical protein